jgi:high-affinity Fe2+/Pb2+ permease
MQRSLLLVLIGLVIGGAALIILSIWGVDLGAALFKILATIGVLILLVGFLMVVKMDFGEHKRLKDENFLD